MTDESTPEWKADLLAGYARFRTGAYQAQEALYETLGQGQSPKVLMISCSDSRVCPTEIFAAAPGELFAIRNVAAIVPPYSETGYCSTAAAIQYAVTVLKIEAIVVMGHGACGGAKGCLDGMGHDPATGAVGRWVGLMNDARDIVLAQNPENAALAMEHEVVRTSLANLMTYPYVKAAVESENLVLQGAHFSIADGVLCFTNEDGFFEKLS